MTQTVSVNCWDAVLWALSVTLTVNVDSPACVGVPVSPPVVLFKLNPAGSMPVVTAHAAYTSVPPVASNVWLYAASTTPEGSGEVDVIVRGAT